jgi:hypothetical protein
MSKETVYVVIGLKDFSIGVYTTISGVARAVGCHRNTITRVDKGIYGEYMVVEAEVHKIKKEKSD